MNRPRLFLSTVSEELRSARQSVAATVRTLGYDPVMQDDFPTGHGELLQWLRMQIDSCEGLIQIVGQGYGAEPPDVDPEFGRVSYTQFEFLYARRRGKKTWLIIAGDKCQRDKPSDQLDLPRDTLGTVAAHPNPAGYQALRRKLQQDYLARVQQENHLWHMAESLTELQNIVMRLRDELGELRQRGERQQRRLSRIVALILAALVVLTAGGWWGYRQLHRDVQQAVVVSQQAAVVNTEKIRAHLLETANQTHERELAKANEASDWKERQKLRDAADAAHAARLARIEELAASFAEIEGRGTSTSVFQELTRILTEQGVDEAIAYVASQRSSILTAVRARTTATHQRNRAALEPLLKAAALYENKGQSAEARAHYRDILAAEPDWPEALHACFWFLASQGDAARDYATLADALSDYEEAHLLAQRLLADDPRNSRWQRNLSVSCSKLGDVERAQGNLDAAARNYDDGLTIAKKLAENDPRDRQWQRDLSVSYNKLGEVAIAQGNLDAAARNHGDGLMIAQKLAASDPSNTEWQRDLWVSYNKLGEVAIAQGNLDAAARNHGDGLMIAQKLAASDPSNTEWQRDLSVSYTFIGNVMVAQGNLKEAARNYGEYLAIAKKLAAGDPSNTQWQRDLSISYNKLGEVERAQGNLDAATRNYGEDLAITKKLAAGDPSNTEWQRDLSISYEKLGDVAVERSKLEETARAYGDGLKIREKLAARDPGNTQWQCDVAALYAKMAELTDRRAKPDEARAYRKQALDAISGVDERGLHLLLSPDDRKLIDRLRRKATDDR